MKRVTEFLQAISYYRSPKIGFLEEVHFETKSGKGRRNSETNVACSEFQGGFNGAKIGFYLLSFGSFRVLNGKNRETPNSPPTLHRFFSVHRPNKKNNCYKMIVSSSSIIL